MLFIFLLYIWFYIIFLALDDNENDEKDEAEDLDQQIGKTDEDKAEVLEEKKLDNDPDEDNMDEGDGKDGGDG